jgi:23S rRNA (cytosine1962-C5)-methyltransferase
MGGGANQEGAGGRARLRLRLMPRGELAVRRGHPWVFAGSVREQNREGEAGELAVIYGRDDRFMAAGFYDPGSPLRVRVVQSGQPRELGEGLWRERMGEARRRREEAGVFDEGTDGGRWVNGESDGLPGLVVDRYGEVVVAKLYSAGWLVRWGEIEVPLREVFGAGKVVRRLSRKLLGEGERMGLGEGYVGGEGERVVVFRESGLFFEAAVCEGQKTGFFLDQRDNRRRVEGLARGREVANVCSYTGGFSVYAARGGAFGVTDIDVSAAALEGAKRNLRRNIEAGLVGEVRHEVIKADAFRWLAGIEAGKFGLVVIDPPSMAKRESEREGALLAYERLAEGGLRALGRGGRLVAASCSAQVAAAEFYGAVRRAAGRSGRRWKELWRSGHAADHEARFAEGEYLKAIWLEDSP